MDVLKKEESGEKRTAISLEEAVPKINKEEEEEWYVICSVDNKGQVALTKWVNFRKGSNGGGGKIFNKQAQKLVQVDALEIFGKY